MHNVILSEGSGLNMRVRWLRAKLHSTRPAVAPSFDEKTSFRIDIDAGVVGMNLADLARALNGSLLKGTSIKNVSITPQGQQLKVNATLHKGIELPVEMISDVAAAPDGRIRMHIAKLRVLKVPMKGLLDVFHVTPADIVGKGAKGMELVKEDIYFDPEEILPQPRKRGKLTKILIRNGEIVQIYGAPRPEVRNLREWRNFIALRGGTLGFGKLLMQHTDIVMIDLSQDEYFKFDHEHYAEQLVNGYTRLTPQAGLRIFMPDIDRIPRTKANQNIGLEWMKNRNVAPPEDLLP